jgi:nitroreductase
MNAIYKRRSVRAYSDKPVGEAAVRELLDAAVQAPTAMHLEPWAFAIVQDKAVLKRYSDRAKAMLRAPAVAVGWGSAGRSASDHPAMLDDPAFNIFYDAGTLIVICRRQKGRFADADCWLAAENLMLAAAQKGLATCCIGFAIPVLNRSAVKRELGIPAEGAAVAAIVVGDARGAVPAVPRKAPQILAWIKQ